MLWVDLLKSRTTDEGNLFAHWNLRNIKNSTFCLQDFRSWNFNYGNQSTLHTEWISLFTKFYQRLDIFNLIQWTWPVLFYPNHFKSAIKLTNIASANINNMCNKTRGNIVNIYHIELETKARKEKKIIINSTSKIVYYFLNIPWMMRWW